jgi:hypothetical protein
MKKYLTYAIAAFFATIVVANASPEADMIIAKEKAAWQAFKDKKVDDFKKLLAPNMVAVYSDGFFTLQRELDLMAKVDMKSFSLSDINVTMTDADTAIITCKAKVESSMAGKDTSHESNSASVWKKTGGEWHAIFHADMKADAPAPDAQKKE